MTDPGQQELQSLYERRFRGQADYRRRVWEVLIRQFFDRYIPAQGAVLDLGCGYGEFINQVRARARYAMDLNQSAAQHLEPGIELFAQDCSADWPLPPDSLDLVFSSNFFEHLPDKAALGRTLRQAWRALKPGGRLIAVGPNIKYVHAAYWDFWDHTLPLTELSLSEGLEANGFAIERCFARFLPYTMVNAPRYPIFLLSLYLKMPLAWSFFGKQFLLIARKTGPS